MWHTRWSYTTKRRYAFFPYIDWGDCIPRVPSSWLSCSSTFFPYFIFEIHQIESKIPSKNTNVKVSLKSKPGDQPYIFGIVFVVETCVTLLSHYWIIHVTAELYPEILSWFHRKTHSIAVFFSFSPQNTFALINISHCVCSTQSPNLAQCEPIFFWFPFCLLFYVYLCYLFEHDKYSIDFIWIEWAYVNSCMKIWFSVHIAFAPPIQKLLYSNKFNSTIHCGAFGAFGMLFWTTPIIIHEKMPILSEIFLFSILFEQIVSNTYS